MVTIILPPQLALLANNKTRLEVEAASIKDIFDELDVHAPMVRSQLLDTNNTIRQFVGLFINDQQLVEYGDGSEKISADSEFLVVMAAAGG
jgi:hypothetical protein